MIFYRCKCGKSTAWCSGMAPAECLGCPTCGSDLAVGPDAHEPVKPHDFSLVEEVATDNGPQPRTRCRHCLKTRAEIEAKEKSRKEAASGTGQP